ncbi:PilZ domain-containing protein [Sphingomonas sp.]|jgi:hypothetical protein|uniref:PilZ domain-containing protein n=1 Tax=Sphingomonas sp. TaxID=28214 RepID=UPI002D805D1F|nr:PilZ domain-containing protein [Sphingomonas sp.]HEU0045278.1 PilZ domain-containing protein [Sphingomonas sp.]
MREEARTIDVAAGARRAEYGRQGSEPSRPQTPRAATRRKVFSPAWLDTVDGRYRAHLLNLSAIGACVHARCTHRVWSGVTLRIGDRMVEARVTWVMGERCGVKFTQPLTPAELDAATS